MHITQQLEKTNPETGWQVMSKFRGKLSALISNYLKPEGRWLETQSPGFHVFENREDAVKYYFFMGKPAHNFPHVIRPVYVEGIFDRGLTDFWVYPQKRFVSLVEIINHKIRPSNEIMENWDMITELYEVSAPIVLARYIYIPSLESFKKRVALMGQAKEVSTLPTPQQRLLSPPPGPILRRQHETVLHPVRNQVV